MAMSLVELACEKASGLGDVRVEALHLRLGALSGVVKEALLFSFDVAAEGTPVAGARLEIEDVPLTVRCPRCAVERELAGLPAACARCARRRRRRSSGGRTWSFTRSRWKRMQPRIVEVREGDPQEERPRRARAARPLREGGRRRREPGVESRSRARPPCSRRRSRALKTTAPRRGPRRRPRHRQRRAPARPSGRSGAPDHHRHVCHLDAQMVARGAGGLGSRAPSTSSSSRTWATWSARPATTWASTARRAACP